MALVKLFNLDKHLCADERGLIQILKDAYNGTVQKSQTEQLAEAIAQQNIKVHRAYMSCRVFVNKFRCRMIDSMQASDCTL